MTAQSGLFEFLELSTTVKYENGRIPGKLGEKFAEIPSKPSLESYEELYKLCEEAIFACGGAPITLLEAESMSEIDDESVLQPLVLQAVKLFCQNFNNAHVRDNKPGIQLPYGKALRLITDHTVSDKLSAHIEDIDDIANGKKNKLKAGSLLPRSVLPLSRHRLPRTLANATVEFWQLLEDLDLEKFGDAIADYTGDNGSYAVLASIVTNENEEEFQEDFQELLDECVNNFSVVWGEEVALDRWEEVLNTILARVRQLEETKKKFADEDEKLKKAADAIGENLYKSELAKVDNLSALPVEWRDGPVPKYTDKGREIAKALEELQASMETNNNKFQEADGKILSKTIAEANAFFQARIDMYTKYFINPNVKHQVQGLLKGLESLYATQYDGVFKLKIASDQSIFQFEHVLKDYNQQLNELNAGRSFGQKHNDIKTIFEHGASVRTAFTSVFAQIAEDTDAAIFANAPMKAMMRALEKAALREPENRFKAGVVVDIVRGALVYNDVAGCLNAVEQIQVCEDIVVVRMKDRFSRGNETSGGWRDVLFNIYMKDDVNQHICEIQIHHQNMLTVRSELGGHYIYSIFRSLLESLEVVFGRNGHLLVEQAGAEWSADETGVGRQVIVSADRKIVTKTTRGWGDGSAVTSDFAVLNGRPILKRWSFKLLKGTKVTIGVVTSEFDAKKDMYINKTSKGWGFYQEDGKIGHNGKAETDYGTAARSRKFLKGDVIDVEVDVLLRNVRFYVNNQDCGIAFTNLPESAQLHGAVSLYNKGDELQIMQNRDTFDSTRLGTDVVMANSEKTVTKKSKGWRACTAVLMGGTQRIQNVLFTPRKFEVRHRWSFIFLGGKANGMVGVVTDDFKVSQDKTVAATERGWAYMQGTGGIAHAEENPTENYSDYGEKFTTEHDIVDVDVDRFLGNLRFFLNGRNQGIAFSNLPSSKELYGAVSMFSTGVNFQVQYEGEYLLHVEDWDTTRCSAHAQFSSDGNSLDVGMPGAQGVAVALGRVRVDQDTGVVHRWSFRLGAKDGWELGVVTPAFDAANSTSLATSEFACAITPTDIYQNGKSMAGKPGYHAAEYKYAQGDIIDLELDALRGNVRMYHNGKKRDIAFDLAVATEYNAAVSLAGSHSIELLRELQGERPFFSVVGAKVHAMDGDCTIQNNNDSTFKAPQCDRLHPMRRCSFAGNNAYRNGWTCARHGRKMTGERWFCATCSVDICYGCEALPHTLSNNPNSEGPALERAFKVGEKVRVIQSRADARSNTASAPGWSWLDADAKCGHSGVVQKESPRIFPDPGAGYFIKFPDGDVQSYVHANLRIDDGKGSSMKMDDAQVSKVVGGVLLDKSPLRFRWSFQINAGTHAWIGIIPADFDITANSLSGCKHGYGIIQNGKMTPSFQFFCPAINAGAVVDMELDIANLTLGYFIDGVNMGIAFENLPEGVTFTAAVYLHKQADEISLLSGGMYWPRDGQWDKHGSQMLVRGMSVAIKQEDDGWEASTALSATAVTIPDSPVPMGQPSRQRWNVQIMKGSTTLIGLVTDLFDPQTDGYLSKTLNGWALSQEGLVGHGGECVTPYSAKLDPYTIIDVEVDINVRTLRFFINGNNCGVAYRLPVGTFRLGASIRDQGDGVFLAPPQLKRDAIDLGMQTWDPNRIGPGAKKVIKRGLVCVEKLGDGANAGTCIVRAHASIGQISLMKHRFVFLMIGGASPVGVLSSEFDGSTSVFDTKVEGCGYCPDGHKVIKGSKQKYGDSFNEGDRIAVEVELMSGRVNFYKNMVDQGVAYYLPRGVSVSPLTSLSTKGDVVAILPVFMDYPGGSGIELSPCKRRVKKMDNGWHNGTCLVAGAHTLGTAPADNEAIVSWLFMIEVGTRVTIGIVKRACGEPRNIANQTNGWCLCQDGKKYHDDTCGAYADPLTGNFTEVKMELDLVARTLRFHVNGKDLGLAYTDLPDGVVVNAAVSLYKKDDSVYLLSPTRSVTIDKGTAIMPVNMSGLGIKCQRANAEDWNDGAVIVPFRPLVLGNLEASGIKNPDSPRVRYSFLVHSGQQTAFGIVPDGYDASTDGYMTEHGWGLRQCDGKVRHQGLGSKKYATPFKKEGTIVDVEVDVKERSLRFYINNQGYGVAYEDLPAGLKVMGAASLYNASSAVTIMHPKLRSKLHMVGADLTISISDTPNALRITKRATSSRTGSVVFSGPVVIGESEGVYEWVFKVLAGTSSIFGIVRDDYNPHNPSHGYISKTKRGWAMYQKNAHVGNGTGPATAYSTEEPRNQDTVTVVLNSNDATLSFKINGVDQGPAYKNLPKMTVYGCVSLLDARSSVVLLSKTVKDQFVPNTEEAVLQVEAVAGNGIPPENIVEVPVGIQVTRNNLDDWNDGSMVVPSTTVEIGAKRDSSSPKIARWSFIINSGIQSTFGIVKSSYDPTTDSYINKTDKGWGLMQSNGKVGHSSASNVKYTDSFKAPGTIVDMELDLEGKSLGFYIDGEYKDIAFQGLPDGPVNAAVSLFNENSSVTILDQTWRQKFHKMSRNINLTRFAKHLVVKKTVSDWNTGSVVFSGPAKLGGSGVHEWSFKVIHGSDATFGIVDGQYDPRTDGYINKHNHGWGFYQKGNIGHGGPATTKYASRVAEHSVVTVRVNCSERTLSFLVDDVDKGVAFSDLPDGLEVFGACHLHRVDSAVALLRKTTPDEWLHVDRATVSTVDAAIGKGIENIVQVPAGIKAKRRYVSGWNDGTVIVPGRTATIGTLDGSSPLTRWSFIVHSGSRSTFGIVTDQFDADADGYINKTERGWGLYQGDGKLGHNGKANIQYTKGFRSDTLVDVNVDVLEGTLSFAINGVPKGIAFDNLPAKTEFRGAMSLYDAGAQVTVLNPSIRNWLRSLGPDLLLTLDESKSLSIKKSKTSWTSGTVVLSGGVTIGEPGGNAVVTYAPNNCPKKHGLEKTQAAFPAGCSVCGRKRDNISTAYVCTRCDFVTCSTCSQVATVTYPGAGKAGPNAVHAWTFVVVKGTNTTFGIVDAGYRPRGMGHGYLNKTNHGWGFYYTDGKLGHGGPAKKRYFLGKSHEDTTISVVLDSGARTLRFIVNNVDLGEAFTDLEDGLVVYGAASLYRELSSILVTGKSTSMEPEIMDLSLTSTSLNPHLEVKKGVGVAKIQRQLIGLRATRNDKNSWINGSVVVPDIEVVIGQPYDPLEPITRWSFIVHSGSRSTFGIVTDQFDADADGYINKTERGWGLWQGDGKLGHKGPATIQYADAFKSKGHLIDVDVDAAAKTLKFSVDNKAYGVAFNLPTGTKVSGAFSMYNARASVTCLHPKWRNKLQDICTTITLGVRSSSLMMTKKVSNDQTGLVMFSGPAKLGGSGVHEWSFKVLDGSDATFGIVDASCSPVTYTKDGDQSWVLHQDGTIRHGAVKNKRYTEPITDGDEVTVRVDCKARTLSFLINGLDKGVAFSDLVPDMRVCGGVHMPTLGSSITLLSKTTPDWTGVRTAPMHKEGPALERAFKVGEKVRVIQSRADARSNTASAPGWSWSEAEAKRCGHWGMVHEEIPPAFPDPGAGYFIKFPDGDVQRYVHSNVRPLGLGGLSGGPSTLDRAKLGSGVNVSSLTKRLGLRI